MKGNITLGGISATFGGYISDIWGGHQRHLGGDISDKDKLCITFWWGGHQRHLGGTSATFGGDISDIWGGHQRQKYPSTPQKTWRFLPLNFF